MYQTYRTQITACDARIDDCLGQFDAQIDLEQHPLSVPKNRRKKPTGNTPAFDLRTHLYRISGVDYYEQQYKQRVINNLRQKARAFGFELTPNLTARDSVS